MEEYWSFFY